MDNNALEWEDLKDILELVGEGVIYQKADGKIIYCNQKDSGVAISSHSLSRPTSCSWPWGEKAHPPRLRYLTALSCLLCLLIIWAAPAWGHTVKRVLVLHSYHQCYSWEKGLGEAINRTFAQADFTVQVFHEYMDTLRLPDPGLQVAFFNHLQARYANARLDLILASDNEALTFLLNYRDWLYGPIPVVFVGINGYAPAMLRGKRGYTGVAEQVDILSTLRAALDLLPQTRRVVVFGRLSMTYFQNLKLLKEAVAKLGGGLQVVERPGLTLGSVLKEVASLGEGDMVLLTEPVADEQGRLVAFSRSTPLITQASSAPVYSLWDVVLGKGIVGGKVVSAAEQGRVGVEMALKILAGQDPASLPVVTESPNRYMFDYQQLARFHMPLSALPRGSIVINQPKSLWARYKAAILVLAGLLLLMFLTIGALAFAVVTRRRSEAALRQSEERFRSVVDQAGDAILLHDNEGLILDVNPAACKSLGYTRDELLGLSIQEVDPRVERDQHKEKLWEKLTPGKSVRFDGQHRRKDGTLFPVEINLSALKVGGDQLMLGLARDISEQKRIGKEREANLKFLESMDLINRAIQGTNDLDQMMRDVLDQVLAIFDCDRASLVYPCDPKAPSWRVPMERTKPEYPGAMALGCEIPMKNEIADKLKEMLAAGGPVRLGPHSSCPLPPETAERFGFKSFIGMAIFPKIGNPWEFGLQQCSYARVWTPEEERLFQEIGRRLADALTSLLVNNELRQSEERFRSVVDQAADAIFLIDIQGCIRDVNWEACRSLDYSREELLGFHITDVDPLVEKERHKDKVRKELASGKSVRFVSQHRRKDGTLFPVEINLGVLEFGGDQLMLALVRDISERKQAQETLARSEREYRTLVQNLPDFVVRYDNELRRILVNPSWEKASGLSAAEVVNMPVSDIPKVPNPTHDGYMEKLLETLKTGVTQTIEFRWVNARGEELILDYTLVPEFDSQGQVTGVLSVGHDITQRRRAEEALRQSEEKLSKIFQAAPLGLALTSVEDGRFLDINEALARQLGLPREEALLRTSNDIGFWKGSEQRRKFLETIKRKGGLRNQESVVRARNGQDRFYLWSSEPIELDGRDCLINVTMDITKRKQAEAALHRLNRELQAISSCNQAMIRAVDEKALLEDICRIFCEEAGYRMAWVGYAENDQAKSVRPVAWAGHEEGYLMSANITWDDTERGQGPAGKAIREGKIVCVQDFVNDSQTRPWREKASQREYRSNLTLPLKDDNGKPFGILAIYSREINAFIPDEKRLLEDMSKDMAFGIMALRTREARKLAEKELRRSDERKTILNQIANIFLTVPDADMYEEILAVIIKVMKSKFGIFGYLDEIGDLVVPSLTRDVWQKCQVPEKSTVFPACTWGESLWGRAIHQKRALYADAPFKTPAGHLAINNFLTVPVVFGERTIGVISVANKQESYTETDKELLEGIVGSISPILNARLQRDIHEGKRLEAEQALRESGERITALFNATTDSVILLDPQGSILAINEQGAERRGLRPEALAGKSIYEILPPELVQDRQAKIREVLASAQPAVFEEQWGGRFYFVRMFPVLNNNGDVRQIACFSRDVSEIKRADEEKAKLGEQLRQAQKMEAIGTLAGGIAHDFNNILGAIMGFTQMALDDAKQGTLEPNDLEQVIKAAKRAKDLVRQILTFSRKVEHDLKPLDLNKVVKQAAQLLVKTIPKMIELEMDMADDLQAISADANQMEQVILNLGVNAADAMPEGGELKIATKCIWVENQMCLTCGKLFSGQYVALTVCDSGHGMDQQTLEHIFEPFFTTKGIGKGTGMGLSTVYGIVNVHSGHIFCQSAPGVGTTFTLYFPAIEGEGEASPAADAFAPRPPGGHERILLVDDEETIREIGKRMLQRVGYNVLTTPSGELAVEAYLSKGESFDLIIMDLSMPGMGGYKAMKAILEINPQAKVLVASGYAANERRKDVLNSGAVGFVAKPFQRSAFLAEVRNLLDQS
jgi:PAS domain S-box-containing protein